jgi:hypothetical protein
MSTLALNSEWNRANGLRFEKPLAFGELLAVKNVGQAKVWCGFEGPLS